MENSGFSHKKMSEEVIKIKVRRAITQVQGDNPNTDVATKHPDWVREANQKKYDVLTKSITDEVKKYQLNARERRLRLHGKN